MKGGMSKMVIRLINDVLSNFTFIFIFITACIVLSLYSKLLRKIILTITAVYSVLLSAFLLDDANIIEVPFALYYLTKEILTNSLYIVHDGSALINYFASTFNNRLLFFILFHFFNYLYFYSQITYRHRYFYKIVRYFKRIEVRIKHDLPVTIKNVFFQKLSVNKLTVVLRC